MRVVIIGGGSAGTTCAFELRKLNKEVEITLIEKTINLEYSPCALPYVLSGEIKDFKDIFIFTKEDYSQNNINLLLNSNVTSVDIKNKEVVYEQGKQKNKKSYDKLVLATGSSAFIPPVEGIEKINFFVLKTIEDAKKISSNINKGDSSIIVGAGMIGIELAVSLAKKGEKVKIIEAKENILPGMFDKDLSDKLKEYLESKKIGFCTNSQIKKVSKDEVVLDNEKISFDKIFLCAGIKPNLGLANNLELKTDKGIIVNDSLETSQKEIYACGDCVESFELNSGKGILSALGTTAVRQAKIIAKNILGEKEKFPEVMNNTISKIGDLYTGSVGLTASRAKELGIKTISARYSGNLRAEYYSNKERITIKVVCNEKGIVIGGQIIGDQEVVGRLDLLALAIKNKNHVKDLASLETCYNPPSAPIFDPLTVAAEICLKKLSFMEN